VTPGEGREGADILPDRVVQAGDGDDFPAGDVDAQEFTDLDADTDAIERLDDGDDDSR
jgi:hypothetical protein